MEDKRIFDPAQFAVEVTSATDAWKVELLAWVAEVGRLQKLGHELVAENSALRQENIDLSRRLEAARRRL